MKTVPMLMALAALAASPAIAYEQPVHMKMSNAAAHASVLKERVRDYGLSLGIQSLEDPLEDGYATTISYGGEVIRMPQRHSVVEWIQMGADAEDAFIRPRHHFYNPLMGEGMEGLVYGVPGRPSLDWALGQKDSDSLAQEYSLSKAKEYLYKGLLADTERDRRRNLTLLFLSLGHVVHLIQDLGQPQHTRNDVHTPLSGGSLYETWTNEYRDKLTYGGYGAVKLTSPQMAWTTCARGAGPCLEGKGLANYSNREFVTAGTNFRGRFVDGELKLESAKEFRHPDGLWHEVDKLQVTDPKLRCPTLDRALDPALTGETWLIRTPVFDAYTGARDTTTWTSTLSIYDPDLQKKGADLTFNFINCNAQSTQRLLVPQAVGYSAGLFNYFARGRIEISLPDAGAYAYADHSTATGFSSITAKIKNVSPNDHLKGGKLVMAVKFHRNLCYKPDLSGEFTSNGTPTPVPPCENYREEPESMIVSEPHPAVDLESGKDREFTFKFKTELPMNATDVYLQVVYRGKLASADGKSAEDDAIVVGAHDISEPVFYTLANLTDMYVIPNKAGTPTLYYWKSIIEKIAESPYSIVDKNGNKAYDGPPADEDVYGGDIAFELYLEDRKIAAIPALPQGRFARLALLVDPVAFHLDIKVVGAGFNNVYGDDVRPRVAQMDYSKKAYVVTTVYDYRETKQFWTHGFYHRLPGVVLPDSDPIELPSKESDGHKPFTMESEAFAPFAPPRLDPGAVAQPDSAASVMSMPAEPARLPMNTPLN